MEYLHPDYREMVRERILRSYEERRPMEFAEEKIIRLDGEVVDVEVATVPIIEEGKPAIYVLIRDITERKKAEAALESDNAEEAREALNGACRTLDKTAQKGIIHRNTASRKKSRLTKKFNERFAS